MQYYQKQINLYYRDLTNYRIDYNVLDNIYNIYSPKLFFTNVFTNNYSSRYLALGLIKKKKHAIYVQDLYAILYALQVDNTKPLHGSI